MTAAQLAADERLPFLDFPTEVVQLGVAKFNALVGQYHRGNNLVEGGLSAEYELELMLERSEVPGAPVKNWIYEGLRFVFRNRLFCVSDVKEDDEQSEVIVTARFSGERQPVNPLLDSQGNWLISADGQPIEG